MHSNKRDAGSFGSNGCQRFNAQKEKRVCAVRIDILIVPVYALIRKENTGYLHHRFIKWSALRY